MATKKAPKEYQSMKVPTPVYELLKIWAEQSGRNLGKELEVLIKESNRTLPVSFNRR